MSEPRDEYEARLWALEAEALRPIPPRPPRIESAIALTLDQLAELEGDGLGEEDDLAGPVRRGSAGPGVASPGTARQADQGAAWPVSAGHHPARRGEAGK